MCAGIFAAPAVAGSGYHGLKAHPTKKLFSTMDSVSWIRKTKWNPINNKKFEALSYLTPLSDDSIAKEIDYMMKKGWIPCLEFDDAGSMHREHSRILRWKVLDIVEAPYVWMHRLLISSPP
ncbi:hypothetical protein NC651_016434 [Populus alba x Populus x berolinensis]|nr:hypothetical protein NC651_016434 [Populus alba x Populus x berolinensis]